MHRLRHLLDGAQGASSNTNTLTIDANRLKIHVLATFGGDVGVATRVAEDWALSTKLADTGHSKEIRLRKNEP